MALIISEAQTRKLVDMQTALKLVDGMFRSRAAGKVRSVPRRRLKGSEKQLNMMAAWQSDWDWICLRAYAGASNTITLYHGRTGQIQAIIDMGYLSSLRTGAATGVAAKYLAPSNTRTLGVIGPGWQATFQVEAVASSCPIQEVVVYGRNPKRRKEFIRQMSKVVKADWKEADTVDDVEAASDILVVSTDSSTTVVPRKPTAAISSRLAKPASLAGRISYPWKRSSAMACRNRDQKECFFNPTASPTKT